GAAGEMLRRDGGFSNVVQPGSAVRADIVAEISVTQLYGDNREPGSPYAVLAIRFTFMNATNGLPEKVLFQRSYLRRIGIDSATPAALMAGWNQAMVTILAEVTDDLRAANKPYRASIQ
ncbi:MAG TPA: hypothetical protein VME24_13570, partial [Alphaproteobacteria bacterium]|nr:hypothetical protein [Alphaproteobacteria bacterium]